MTEMIGLELKDIDSKEFLDLFRELALTLKQSRMLWLMLVISLVIGLAS